MGRVYPHPSLLECFKIMVTITTISEVTGLSISIISRYLNGHNVREKNRILIEKAIKETGYVPNDFARNLRVEQTKCIGVIIPEFNSVFTTSVLNVVETMIMKSGYSLILSNCHGDKNFELTCAKTLIQKRVNALLILPLSDCQEISVLARNNNIPVLVFDQYIKNKDVDYVLFDNKGSSYRAAEILTEYGHKNIGIIAGPQNVFTAKKRLEGFIDYFEKNNIHFPKENIYRCKEFDTESAYQAAKECLSKENHPTALFTSSFYLTIGTLKAINEMNLRIPEDISLIAFDSLPFYEVLKPKLWTINQPYDLIGKTIAKNLLDLIENRQLSSEKIDVVSYSINEGESIKRL